MILILNHHYSCEVHRRQLKEFIFLLVFLSPLFCFSQDRVSPDSSTSLERYFQFDSTESLSFLETIFPPILMENGIELKAFVRSNEMKRIRQRFGDVQATDAIFIRSMQLTHNNTGMALLLALFATFDHRYIRLKIPLFALAIPLSDESEEEFTERVRNLPRKLFPDSPPTAYADRDKLQHFFGSAFITYIFNSSDAAERFGLTVERGEPALIVGGADDVRDIRTNTCGQQFGLALMDSPFRRPSEFLSDSLSVKVK